MALRAGQWRDHNPAAIHRRRCSMGRGGRLVVPMAERAHDTNAAQGSCAGHAMSGAVRILIAALSLSAAAGVSHALSPPTASRGVAAGDTDDASQYAVPTRMDRVGRIVAQVTINGRGPFRFMLDTGSTRTVVAESALGKLGLTANTDATIAVAGISGSELAPSVHIDSLDAGDLHFRDLDLPVLAGPVFHGLDGILGMDGFEGMKLSADFSKDHITISQSLGKRPSLMFSVMHAEFLSDRLLMVDGRVGPLPTKAIIDTGGTHTLGNSALLAALTSAHRRGVQVLQTGVIDVTQAMQPAVVGRVPDIRLGDATIANLFVTFGDFQIFRTWGLEDEPALLIGMDVLGSLEQLSIDYRRKEIDLLPHSMERTLVEKRYFSLGEW